MMTRTMFGSRCPVALVCAMLVVGTSAWAQSTATLQGTVTDTQSAVMPGVSIVIRNMATGIERSVLTDAAGQYVDMGLTLRQSLTAVRMRAAARLLQEGHKAYSVATQVVLLPQSCNRS